MKVRIPDEARIEKGMNLTEGKEYLVLKSDVLLATIKDDVGNEILIIFEYEGTNEKCRFLKNEHAWEVVETKETI